MTRLDRLAFRHARALGTAESALATIRQMAERLKDSDTRAGYDEIARMAARAEADIARAMREEIQG